ncbi:hypothetical protein B0A55_03449, partial [Friedmanniomyces simplex]
MSRVHGNHTCYMCGKLPGIGWLYVCIQDREFDHLDPPDLPDSLPLVSNESSYYDVQARVAESVGIAASVVKGIRDRQYSFEQVDKLIEQKKHLLATIRRQENPTGGIPPSQNARPRTPSATDSVIASVGTTADPPVQTSTNRASANTSTVTHTTQTDGATEPAKKIKSKKQNFCNFQVCHACRPFFKDRLYMSFEKMLSGRLPAVTEEDIKKLPMLDPAIVRNLGLRRPYVSPIPTPLSASFSRSLHQGDGYDEDASDWTPTSATIS